MTRRHPTYAEGMAGAAQAIQTVARQYGLDITCPSILAEAAVNAYLVAHRRIERTRTERQLSPITRQMMAMRPGDVVTLPTIHRQTLFGYWRTARKLLNNPTAKWSSHDRPGGIEVIRLPDGAAYRKPPTSAIVKELMTLKPGESVLSKTLRLVGNSRTNMDTAYKASARRYLNDNNADWTVKLTNHGVRLTRVR